MGDTEKELGVVPAVAMLGGTSVYLLAHVAFRWRNIHTLNRQRLVVGVALPLLILVALEVSALATLAILAGVLVALVAYEAIHFGEARERLRRRLLHEAQNECRSADRPAARADPRVERPRGAPQAARDAEQQREHHAPASRLTATMSTDAPNTDTVAT